MIVLGSMEITSDEDKKEFENYKNIKGIDIYKHVIKIYKDKNSDNPDKKFNYRTVASYIRYDKSIRNILFVYLAYLEENLRAELLKKDEIIIKKGKKKLSFKISSDNEPSEFYFYISKEKKKFTFNKLIDTLSNNNNINEEKKEEKKEELKDITKLRNSVMHHNFILLKDAKNWEEAKKNIQDLKHKLEFLIKYLKSDVAIEFINKLNELNKKVNAEEFSTLIKLENIELQDWNIVWAK